MAVNNINNGGVGVSGPAALGGKSGVPAPRSSPLVTVPTGFVQLTAASAAPAPDAAPSVAPSFRLPQGVNIQRALSSALTTGNTGTAAAATSTGASTPAGTSGSGGSTPVVPNTSGQGGGNGSSEEVDEVKGFMKDLQDSGQPGTDDELWATATFMKSTLDGIIQKNQDRTRAETKQYLANLDRYLAGEDPDYSSPT